MKKLLLLFTILITVLACSKTKDYKAVKVGMKSSEVVVLLGEPNEKSDIFGNEIWMYKEGDEAHVILIASDTVSSYRGGKEIKDSLEKLK